MLICAGSACRQALSRAAGAHPHPQASASCAGGDPGRRQQGAAVEHVLRPTGDPLRAGVPPAGGCIRLHITPECIALPQYLRLCRAWCIATSWSVGQAETLAAAWLLLQAASLSSLHLKPCAAAGCCCCVQIDINPFSEEGWAFTEASLVSLCQNGGAKLIRLDAFGYVTKKAGTSCFMEVRAVLE